MMARAKPAQMPRTAASRMWIFVRLMAVLPRGPFGCVSRLEIQPGGCLSGVDEAASDLGIRHLAPLRSIWRDLAAAEPDRHRPDLAASLTNLTVG